MTPLAVLATFSASVLLVARRELRQMSHVPPWFTVIAVAPEDDYTRRGAAAPHFNSALEVMMRPFRVAELCSKVR